MKIESKLGVDQYIFSKEELELIDDALADARYTAMSYLETYNKYDQMQEYKDTKIYFEKYSNLERN